MISAPPSLPTAPLVTFTDVVHRYDARFVLDVPRLVLPPGSTAILGPNGAGKSTLLHLVSTLATPSGGVVAVAGDDVAEPAHRVATRRRLGYAGQADHLPARMRVGEYCDYVAALKEIGSRRRRRRWTVHVLATVGLDRNERDRIDTLSGGMRRRLILAQSLIGGPDLLVLDEPLVSLDAEHRTAIVRLIAASATDRTTIVATHDGDEVAAICTNVVVLAEGRIAFAGSPAALAHRAAGSVWETTATVDHPSVRATGPGRFRVVGWRPPASVPAEPTVHDGYLAVLHARTFPAPGAS